MCKANCPLRNSLRFAFDGVAQRGMDCVVIHVTSIHWCPFFCLRRETCTPNTSATAHTSLALASNNSHTYLVFNFVFVVLVSLLSILNYQKKSIKPVQSNNLHRMQKKFNIFFYSLWIINALIMKTALYDISKSCTVLNIFIFTLRYIYNNLQCSTINNCIAIEPTTSLNVFLQKWLDTMISRVDKN